MDAPSTVIHEEGAAFLLSQSVCHPQLHQRVPESSIRSLHDKGKTLLADGHVIFLGLLMAQESINKISHSSPARRRQQPLLFRILDIQVVRIGLIVPSMSLHRHILHLRKVVRHLRRLGAYFLILHWPQREIVSGRYRHCPSGLALLVRNNYSGGLRWKQTVPDHFVFDCLAIVG